MQLSLQNFSTVVETMAAAVQGAAAHFSILRLGRFCGQCSKPTLRSYCGCSG